MRNRKTVLRLFLTCTIAIVVISDSTVGQLTAFDYSKLLGQGINLGNTLEAPNEGDWGFVLEPWHFETIAEGGFDSVRVPIRWSAHADANAPYAIDNDFLERIDWVVDQARTNKLAVILNVHHYDEIFIDPANHRDRLLGLWDQIATRYQDQPNTLFFEILNEPHNALTPQQWNPLLTDALDVIRETNPDRQVIIGPTSWNNLNDLPQLDLPADDQNLIATYHYYSPFQFTHQGAEWVEGSDAWLGTTWSGTAAEEAAVVSDFDFVANWAAQEGRPIFLGEFGAYRRADNLSRSRWTEFVRSEAEARDFSWSYWEFGAGFGAYDRDAREWFLPIYNSLAPSRNGDYDGDSDLDLNDVDALVNEIVLGSGAAAFDFNDDGDVDNTDLALWLLKAESLPGDANVDGTVDGLDFILWNESKFTTGGSWSGGDFNADGITDGLDFIIWNEYKFQSVFSQTSVPEPAVPMGLLGLLSIAIGRSAFVASRLTAA